MQGQNKIKLIMGLVFVVAAFVCIGVLFYMMGEVNLEHQKKIASLEVQLSNLIAERASSRMSGADAVRAAGSPLTLQDLLDKANSIYTQEEKNQREGFLWIDREAKTFLITLGALNGLAPGSRLDVYEGDQVIDTVTVESTYDVVSCVRPVQRKLDEFRENYYRVMVAGGS